MLPLAGDTFQTFTVLNNGSYAVVIEKDKCIDTSFCVEVSGLGLNDHASDNFKIYPIPSTGKIFIELGMELDDVTIELTNLHGQITQRWSFEKISKTELDLQSPKGIYLLRIKTRNENAVFKIIKE